MEQDPHDTPQELVDLPSVLWQCVHEVQARYRLPGECLRLELRPCSVLGRRGDLELVFRNLLDNAVKYAGRPPRVLVEGGDAGNGWVVVRVRDNGRGIPRHLRRKLFRRFVRLGLELERTKPGTGLGLYIVRTLVKRLGGRVRVGDATELPELRPGQPAAPGHGGVDGQANSAAAGAARGPTDAAGPPDVADESFWADQPPGGTDPRSAVPSEAPVDSATAAGRQAGAGWFGWSSGTVFEVRLPSAAGKIEAGNIEPGNIEPSSIEAGAMANRRPVATGPGMAGRAETAAPTAPGAPIGVSTTDKRA
jgi:signal transduction histidine kinase